MANTITQTTLSGLVKAEDTIVNVVSGAGISAPIAGFMQQLYVINPDSTRGEIMNVNGVNGGAIQIARLDLFRQRFVGPLAGGGLGAIVLIEPAIPTGSLFNGPFLSGFQEFDPIGSTLPNQSSSVNLPWVNLTNGNQWLYSTLTGVWVPGWNHPNSIKGMTAAVASAAGAILPSGPLFHVTGTAAITGFTMPVGFAGGSFTIIPDGAFTWTTAGNIAIAGTAVVGVPITFTYDSYLGKFYPAYNLVTV